MNRFLPWRWALFSCSLALIAVASLMAKEPAPSPQSGLRPRFVHVHYAWAQHRALEADNPGMTVYAYVQAHGLRGETVEKGHALYKQKGPSP